MILPSEARQSTALIDIYDDVTFIFAHGLSFKLLQCKMILDLIIACQFIKLTLPTLGNVLPNQPRAATNWFYVFLFYDLNLHVNQP